MRISGVALMVVLAASLAAAARKEETLEQLKARVERTSLPERAPVCIEVAERQVEAANQLYTDGKVEAARAAVEDAVHYAEKARDAATKSGSKLKSTEIAVRKMVRHLADIKRTLSFEDQPAVQAAVDRLERVRTELLAKMFGKENK